MSPENYRDCIDACNECAVICDQLAAACNREHNVASLSRCMSLSLDCSGVCRLAAQLMSRDSEYVEEICVFCENLCQTCANECAKHGHLDQHTCCADLCRTCAEECRKLARRKSVARFNGA